MGSHALVLTFEAASGFRWRRPSDTTANGAEAPATEAERDKRPHDPDLNSDGVSAAMATRLQRPPLTDADPESAEPKNTDAFIH